MIFECPDCGGSIISGDEVDQDEIECPNCGRTARCPGPASERPSRFIKDNSGFIVHQEIGYVASASEFANESSPGRTQSETYRRLPAAEMTGSVLTGKSTAFLGVQRKGWISLGVGLVIAMIVLFVPLLTQLLVALPILIHEFGHALFGWLYGYPSVPALDFTYGGGVTVHMERHILIMITAYVLWVGIFVVWAMNHLKRTVVLLVAVTVYSIIAFTAAHEVVIIFMGHGMELVFAGIFLYRALSGRSIIHPVERPIYGCLAFFILLDDLRFAYRLFTDEASREAYEAAKGGGHVMDFSRIAEDYLSVGLTSVAAFFLICCLITPVLTYAFLRWKRRLFELLA